MNEKNYYEEIIQEIKKIKNEDPEQAVLLLKKELSMPYIPSKYLSEMETLFKEYSIDFDAKKITMSREEVLEIIMAGQINGKQSLALTQVAQYNWVGFEEKIQTIFDSEKVAKNAKTIFVECLISQKLNYDFKIEEKIINLSKIKSIFDSEYCIKNILGIEKKQIDDQIVKRIAMESFLIYISVIFPKNLNLKYEDNVEEMILVAQALLGDTKILKNNKLATEIFETISKN
ncbi:MAG: hypothetical protein KFW07_01970 [Mycoplasmataceae bacterium]|nr:hypothetical protein [Mycoplasmataceae bacterium]